MSKQQVNGQPKVLPDCRRVILESLIQAKDACTASEVKRAVCSSDSNAVRTRLNELCKMGLVEKAGIKVDPISGKRVTSWRAILPGEAKPVALPSTRRGQLARVIAERDALLAAFDKVVKAHPELAEELISYIPDGLGL